MRDDGLARGCKAWIGSFYRTAYSEPTVLGFVSRKFDNHYIFKYLNEYIFFYVRQYWCLYIYVILTNLYFHILVHNDSEYAISNNALETGNIHGIYIYIIGISLI